MTSLISSGHMRPETEMTSLSTRQRTWSKHSSTRLCIIGRGRRDVWPTIYQCILELHSHFSSAASPGSPSRAHIVFNDLSTPVLSVHGCKGHHCNVRSQGRAWGQGYHFSTPSSPSPPLSQIPLPHTWCPYCHSDSSCRAGDESI